MAFTHPQIADDPKKALEDFLRELILLYYPWYSRSVRLHYCLSTPLQLIALFAGFATSILAALTTENTFGSHGSIRILLILLPALGSAATTVAGTVETL